MSDHVVLTIFAALAAATLVVSVRALRCNVRHLRAARTTAPLDGIDLSEATVAPIPAPKTWPVAEDVTDPAVAAAYASLAEDLAFTYAFVGDIAAVIGGAALGVTVTAFWGDRQWWEPLPPLLVAGAGVAMRMIAAGKWEALHARYLDRYAMLTAEPAPLRRERRRGLFGLFR